MRKRIIDWFFTLQSQRGILGEKERRFYTYAYGLLLNKIAIYAIIAIVGTTTGNWIEMFSFLLPFTVLRQYAGGIHLEKPTSCIIFSGFLVFGCGQYLAVTSDIQNKELMKDELVIFVENNLFESELIEKRIKDTISTTIHQPVKYVIPVKKLSRNRIGKKQRKEMKERYEKGEFEDYIKKIEARNF